MSGVGAGDTAMKLVLAPMEGLADDVLRAILTRAGGYDWCVTEFVRITDSVLPHRCYTRLSPELASGARTEAGTPVRVQLLGNDPAMLAANAAKLAELRPYGIDLNFGCPTPLVNRHRGGAALLAEPELLYAIARAVRGAVPAAMPVTAKMRLGIDSTGTAIACAQALEAGGVDELAVHARTRADGYAPIRRWEWVARIREVVKLPLIANGEVWSVADWHAIRAASGCEDVMLGRGAVADPLLARRIREGRDEAPDPTDWREIEGMIGEFWARVQRKVLPGQSPGRLKQWLGLMRRTYPQADRLFGVVREARHGAEVDAILARAGIVVPERAAA